MLDVLVFGAKERCASCINAPSSMETASWLEAALSRVYDQHDFQVRYVDIFNPQNEQQKEFSKRVLDEDLWYPVVVINDKVITEGNPDLKVIYKELDQLGIRKIDR